MSTATKGTDPVGSAPATTAGTSDWRTVDIVVASSLAVAFGVVFWAWGNLWNAVQPAFTGFPPAQGFMYGVWLMPGRARRPRPAQARRRRVRRAGRRRRVGAARHGVGARTCVALRAGAGRGGRDRVRDRRCYASWRLHTALLAGGARRRRGRAAGPPLLLRGLVRRLAADLRRAARRPAGGGGRAGSWLLVRALARTGVLAPFAVRRRPGPGSELSARADHRRRVDDSPAAVERPRLGLAARRPARRGRCAASTCGSSRASGCCCSAPSGAGKSHAAGRAGRAARPRQAGEQEGAVLLDGRAAGRPGPAAGLVLQDPEAALVMGRAGDDVAFGLENRGVPADEIWPRVDEALAAVGFPLRPGRRHRRRSPAASSSGSRWPGSLALRPGLLLLDEVTANLDPDGRRAGPRRRSRGCWPTGRHRRASSSTGSSRWSTWSTGRSCSSPAAASSPTARRPRCSARRAPHWRRAACGCRAGTRRTPARHRRRSGAADGRRPCGFRYPAAAPTRCRPPTSRCGAGAALAVTGPNGAGKSTLALLLAGLLRADDRRGRAPRPALDPPRAGRAAVALARPRPGAPGRHGVPGPGAPVRHLDGARRAGARPAAGRPHAGRRRAARRRAARAARARRARRREPLHALRRREAAALGGDRAGHLAARCSSPTSRRSARTRDLGRAGRRCSPTCATTAAGCSLVTHDAALVDALADRPRSDALA